MKKAIYKYENKINHKIYIGQTNKPERHFNEHLHEQSKGASLIEKAIKKYGIENFEFTILEWTEDYNTREDCWAKYYNCYKPYGYNICKCGGYLPDQQGEKHSQATITEEVARNIQKDLLNFSIPQRQIVKKYHTTVKTVESIKSGHTWDYYDLSYPLRPSESELNNLRAQEVISLLKTTSLSFKEIGSRVGWGESQISMVNQGKNHRQTLENYPIRQNPKDYTDKIEQCISLLKENKKNGEIAELLGTSTAWVSRINNGTSHKNPSITYPIRK